MKKTFEENLEELDKITAGHPIIDEDEFKKVIEMAHEKGIPVMVDDASGARLRTVVFNQAKACDLGADIAITSTDKLMPGPRGGLMAGREDLIDKIKVKMRCILRAMMRR
mgnify:CR=1 FL=1